MVLHLINLNPLHQECFVSSSIEIGPMVLEKKILISISVLSLIRYFLTLEKGGALLLYKLESSSSKGA